MLEKTKNFVKEHKYQIIAGVSITATSVVSILLLKEKVNNKALLESLNNQTEMSDILKECIGDLADENESMKTYYDDVIGNLLEKVEVIHEAMSEGMIQEAIATTTRKLNVREDIIAQLKDNLNDIGRKEKYDKAVREAIVFKRRLKVFNKLAETYTIED